jgi:hypothetical protein
MNIRANILGRERLTTLLAARMLGSLALSMSFYMADLGLPGIVRLSTINQYSMYFFHNEDYNQI